MSKGKDILTSQHSSHGGANLDINILTHFKIKEHIDLLLGKRNARAEYSFGEIILQFFYSKCCNAKRVENLEKSKTDRNGHPLFKKAMSPDTFLRMLKNIAVEHTEILKSEKKTKSKKVENKLESPNIEVKRKRGKKKKIKKGAQYTSHDLYKIPAFNELLIDLAIQFGLIDLNKIHIMDMDTTVILTKVKGSHVVYNGNGRTGYHPLVFIIAGIPFYIENRNGNSNPSFNLKEALADLLDLLERKGVKVGLIRIDAAGFKKELLAYINWKGIKYITRARIERVDNESPKITNWTEEMIKNVPKTVGDTCFKFGKDQVRLVIKKERKNGEESHWGLATNDKNLKMHEVIESYSLRADSENVFSGLNQLQWSIMPKRDIRYNTVYLCVVALCYILYKGLAKFKSQTVTNFHAKMKFTTYMRELFVPCLWLKKRLKFLNKARDYIGLAEHFFFNTGPP